MDFEPRISFRNVEPVSSVREHVMSRIEELEKVHPRIIGCDVVIDAPQKKKATGQLFEVHLIVRIPGPDISVSRKIGRNFAAEDINLAIHKAFDAARKRLKDQKKKMGGVEVKHHPPILHGKIDRLFTAEGYGFIRADDGKELYFGRDSLVGGSWDRLDIGAAVRFREEFGDKGPFAINVTAAD